MSTPLLLSSIIVVLLASPLAWITTLAVLIVAFAGVEAIARRRLLSFVASVAMLIGLLALVLIVAVLLKDYWYLVLSVLLGAAALALLIGNIRDLRHGWRGRGDEVSRRRWGTAAARGAAPGKADRDRQGLPALSVK